MTFDEFMGMRPYEITLFMSGGCNFNCEFCGFKDTRLFPDMSLNTADSLYKELDRIIQNNNTKVYINFMGGEPTLDMQKLTEVVNILNPLRIKYPDNIRFEITSNGSFAEDKDKLEMLHKLNFDLLIISCSKDHLAQGNAVYIKQLINSGYVFNVKYNAMLCDIDILNEYEKCIGCSIRENAYYSSNCLTLNESALTNFYAENQENYDITYAPFGLFVIDNAIYTSCSGEGMLPWCKLSDGVANLDKLLEHITDKKMIVNQPCCRECIPTCRYLQSKGYTCFNGQHQLKIRIKDDLINISEEQIEN